MKYLILCSLFASCTSTVAPDYADCLTQHDMLYCTLRYHIDTPAPGEIAVDHGEARCMAPPEYADLAEFYAADMAACREALTLRLGYDCGGRPLKRIAITDRDPRSYHGQWSGMGTIVTQGPQEWIDRLRDNLPLMWTALERDGCVDWHENTHAAIGPLPLPVMLNEGLAVDMSPHQALVCITDGFTIGDSETMPYADITAVEGAASWHDSFTAACMWQVLAGEGHPIASVLNALARQSGDFSFMADAVGRPDLRELMRVRFGAWDWRMILDGDEWREALEWP